MKKLVWGAIYILGVCWFLYSQCGNPLDELALINGAKITTGSLVDIREHEQEDARGKVYYSNLGVYSFRLPDGREFKTITRKPSGTLHQRITVEYLPENPSVSRVQGDGCRSVMEWLWRKFGLSILIFAVFISPGIYLLADGFRKLKGG